MIKTAAAAVLFGMLGVETAAWAASPISLLVPQSTAFSVLGHSCGGIQEQAFATGFDATSGYPTGDVYLSTRCGGSGRGGGYHTTTYSAWVGATWDLTGALVTYAVLSAAMVDPTLSAFDQHGNEVYNQSNRAYLVLASGFVPAPRVTGVSPTSGPASGGTTLTISGTGFMGATGVHFGTAAASFTVNGDTSITAVSPAASTGTVDVTVTTPGGTSSASSGDQFRFIAAPAVSGISPDSGPVNGGTLVTITGANFIDVTAVDF
jgi:IPT/TIG domain